MEDRKANFTQTICAECDTPNCGPNTGCEKTKLIERVWGECIDACEGHYLKCLGQMGDEYLKCAKSQRKVVATQAWGWITKACAKHPITQDELPLLEQSFCRHIQVPGLIKKQ